MAAAAAAVVRQRQPGVYIVGPGGNLAQQAEVHTITCGRTESAEEFLCRLAALELRDGSRLEFSFSAGRLVTVLATIPATGTQSTLALVIGEPIRSVLEIMQKHGFGSVTVLLVGGVLLHFESSFTALDPAQLEAMAEQGDEIRIEGRIARLVRRMLPPGLRQLLGL